MITVGITGIIGSGKSTVSGMLREEGFLVIDLDTIGKEVSGSVEVKEGIARTFGPDFLKADGSVDAEKLKLVVFTDREHVKMLEAIVHPRLRAEFDRRIAAEKEKGTKAVIVDGPLIFEKGMYKILSKTVVVSASADKIKERLLKRGMSAEDIDRRTSQQMPLARKRENGELYYLQQRNRGRSEKRIEHPLAQDKNMGGRGYMHLNELKRKRIGELTHIAKELNIDNAAGLRKQELIFAILQAFVDKNESVYGEGVLEVLSEGFGFLRSTDVQLSAGLLMTSISPPPRSRDSA